MGAKLKVFLSSTFTDLKFERRFMLNKLKALGFTVVSMERDYREGFDWRRWSTNQAGQCDLYIRLFDKRIGNKGNILFGGISFKSITELEMLHSRGFSLKQLIYHLHRPFPDYERLLAGQDKEEYQQTIAAEDARRSFNDEMVAYIERSFLDSVPIRSVAELESRLERDTRVSFMKFLFHRLRIYKRAYFDNTYCAWSHAFEDESYVASTSRLGFSWRLRTPLFLFASLFSVPIYLFLSVEWFFVSIILMIVVGFLVAFAYRPSFIWIGTKTIMARGLFARRFVQRPIKAGFDLKPRWQLLNDWKEVGSVSATFQDGAKVFVPLVNDPYRFVRDIQKELNERQRI